MTSENLCIPDIAYAVQKLFLAADNSTRPDLYDFDPRHGYVRLGRTQSRSLLKLGVRYMQGLMNSNQDFQAVLAGDFGSGILTMVKSEEAVNLNWVVEPTSCKPKRQSPRFVESLCPHVA